MKKDFLDKVIAERTKKNPNFPALVEASLRRRQFLRHLAAEREKMGLSQTTVAALMGTSQSAVARIEGAGTDAKISTIDRYAAALGRRVEWRLTKS